MTIFYSGINEGDGEEIMLHKPRYSGINRSGICKCGHSWEDHHLGIVMNEKYFNDTKEIYVAQECEHIECNDEDIYLCRSYEDTLDND